MPRSAPFVAGIAIFLQQPVFEVRFFNWRLAALGGLACLAVLVLASVALVAGIIGNRRRRQK